MVMDAVRGYVQLASGLGDVTRARATEIARALLAGGRDVPGPAQVKDQVTSLAEEIMNQSKVNRDLVLTLVRSEVERAVAALGFAATDDVTALRRRVDALEAEIARAAAATARAATPSAAPEAPASAAPSVGAKRIPRKRAAGPSPSAAGPSSAQAAPRKRAPRRAPASAEVPPSSAGGPTVADQTPQGGV